MAHPMQCVPHFVRKTVEDATKDKPLNLRPERNDSRLVLDPNLASAAIPIVDPVMGSRTSNGVAVSIFLSADAACPLADESAHAVGALPWWASMTAITPTVASILSPAVSTVLDRRSMPAMFRMSPDRIYPAVFTTPAGTHVAAHGSGNLRGIEWCRNRAKGSGHTTRCPDILEAAWVANTSYRRALGPARANAYLDGLRAGLIERQWELEGY